MTQLGDNICKPTLCGMKVTNLGYEKFILCMVYIPNSVHKRTAFVVCLNYCSYLSVFVRSEKTFGAALLLLQALSAEGSCLMAGKTPPDGCIPLARASTDDSLFIFHSETRDKMAAGLTLIYEHLIEGENPLC